MIQGYDDDDAGSDDEEPVEDPVAKRLVGLLRYFGKHKWMPIKKAIELSGMDEATIYNIARTSARDGLHRIKVRSTGPEPDDVEVCAIRKKKQLWHWTDEGQAWQAPAARAADRCFDAPWRTQQRTVWPGESEATRFEPGPLAEAQQEGPKAKEDKLEGPKAEEDKLEGPKAKEEVIAVPSSEDELTGPKIEDKKVQPRKKQVLRHLLDFADSCRASTKEEAVEDNTKVKQGPDDERETKEEAVEDNTKVKQDPDAERETEVRQDPKAEGKSGTIKFENAPWNSTKVEEQSGKTPKAVRPPWEAWEGYPRPDLKFKNAQEAARFDAARANLRVAWQPPKF